MVNPIIFGCEGLALTPTNDRFSKGSRLWDSFCLNEIVIQKRK